MTQPKDDWLIKEHIREIICTKKYYDNKTDTYPSSEAITDYIHKNYIPRDKVEGVKEELALLKSYFEDAREVLLHKNDINWERIDQLLKEWG